MPRIQKHQQEAFSTSIKELYCAAEISHVQTQFSFSRPIAGKITLSAQSGVSLPKYRDKFESAKEKIGQDFPKYLVGLTLINVIMYQVDILSVFCCNFWNYVGSFVSVSHARYL